MRRLFLLPLSFAAAVSACFPGATKRPTAPPSAAAPFPAVPNFTGPWVLATSLASQQVTITTRAVVTIADDTSTRMDTLRATLGASFVWASRAHERVDGILVDYRIAVGGAAPDAPAGLQLPRPFSARSQPSSGSLAFTLPAENTACTDPTLSALQGMHDAWLLLPDTLVVGREWTDTVQTLSCRDRIPLRGTSVRRFRVRRAETQDGSRVVVMIERTSKGRIGGVGEQFGEPVSLAGESSGTLSYAVDPLLGRAVQASGSSLLSLSLTSRRKNQTVRQESSLIVTWGR